MNQVPGKVQHICLARTTRLAACLALLTGLAWAKTASAWEWDSQSPEKRLQFKVAPGFQVLNAPDTEQVGDPNPRFVTAFGVQTTLWPFLFELTFFTTVAVDLSVSVYASVLQTPAGALCMGAGALFRETALNRVQDGQKNMDMSATLGVNAYIEWLFAPGWSGIYLEARQTFVTPSATQLFIGIEASPMLLYLTRQ